MALANVAIMLSRWGYKTLVIDWDLEAPGIEYYFKDYVDITQVNDKTGLIDLLYFQYEDVDQPIKKTNWRDFIVNIILPNGYQTIHLITAGQKNNSYFSKVQNLDFQDFYQEKEGGYFIEQLRNEWKEEYDFVLLDSRTGVTDIGGITTVHLPDYLVLFLTTTEQCLKGTIDIAKKANSARRGVPFDRFPLISIPVPSRFDATEEFKISQSWLKKFSIELSDIYANWLPSEIDKRIFLEITKIPYISYFSFGEKLPVIEQGTSDPQGIGYAYETLAGLIAHNFDAIELFIRNRSEYLKSIQRINDINWFNVPIKASESLTIEERLSVAGYQLLEAPIQTNHSTVYKARDIGLNRIAAIKVLSLSDDQDSSNLESNKSRFIREAQTLASLNHPNIGKFYQVIFDPFAIVMEWIEGKSLDKEIYSDQKLSFIEIIKIGIALSDALSYLHNKGIVHRDIKPSNIIFTENREPVLIDFGIARPLVFSTGPVEQKATNFIGTPKYSSPEQIKNSDNVGIESDLFSLGVVLYELITNKPPFTFGNSPFMYSQGHLPAPDQGTIADPLYKIFCRLLDEVPSKRQTAIELMGDLQKYFLEIEKTDETLNKTDTVIRLNDHVIFGRNLNDITLSKYSPPENVALNFLKENLRIQEVGDYRIWVDYVMPSKSPGASGVLEIDLVVINKFGIFLIEVKNWTGKIEAYEDAWIISGKYKHTNLLYLMDSKVNVFRHGSQKPPKGVKTPLQI